MADILSTEVGYTLLKSRVGSGGRRVNILKLTIAAGVTNTYPATGIPLDRGKLGCPNVVESCILIDQEAAVGRVYKISMDPKLQLNGISSAGGSGVASPVLRIYQGDNDAGADGPLVEFGAVDVGTVALFVEARGF